MGELKEKDESGWRCTGCEAQGPGKLTCPNCAGEVKKVNGYWKWSRSENYLQWHAYPAGSPEEFPKDGTDLSAELVQALFGDEIVCDKDIRGGKPVLKDTRLTIAQMVAEVADGFCLPELATEFQLKRSSLKNIFNSLANFLDRKVL